MTYNCLSQLCFALGDVKGTSLVGGIQSLLFIPIAIVGTKYFGLLGTVLASILPSLMISIWYFPRTFTRLLKLSEQDIKNIINQIFICLLTILLINHIFSFFVHNNFIEFVFFVGVYCVVYGIILYALSVNLRREIKLFLKYFLRF